MVFKAGDIVKCSHPSERTLGVIPGATVNDLLDQEYGSAGTQIRFIAFRDGRSKSVEPRYLELAQDYLRTESDDDA
jgi:hypothetical protein